MATGVNSVIQFTTIMFEGWNDDRYVNNWKYRVQTGELPDTEQAFSDMAAAFMGGVIDNLLDLIWSNCYIERIIVKRISPTVSFTFEAKYDDNQHQGTIPKVPGDFLVAPQMAICFTQRSFAAGRKAIGHKYWGPTAQVYSTDGRLDRNPITGPADLATKLTYFISPITLGTGCVAYPCVCNAKGENVTGANQVREVTISDDVTFMRSRRPGKGM